LDRALEMLAVVENQLADDVQLGDTSIHWLVLEDRTIDLIPYQKGWSCQIVLQIEGSARLT
jgi:hypothetical protein